MSTTTRTVTADELFMMPEDDNRYDLIKGELRKMSPAGSQHGALAARLTIALGQYVEEHDLGDVFGAETGFRLASNPDTVLGLTLLSLATCGFRRRVFRSHTGPARRTWRLK